MHNTLPLSRPLVIRLQSEWNAMRSRPSLLRRAAVWGVTDTLDSLDDLLIATGFRVSRPAPGAAAATDLDHDPDIAMGRLLVVARTDELAARVVLQRLLPGLLSVARRWPSHRRGGSETAFDDLIGVAWGVIREFPLERRPHHLVANLLRDCEYRAFVRSDRRLLVHEPTAPHLLDLGHDQRGTSGLMEPLHELLEIAAQAATLTADDRVLLGLLLSGRSTIEVADALSVSERTVRTYRAAMVERLREAVEVCPAAVVQAAA